MIDEQHRFGVVQRGDAARQRGAQAADLLVMTATPIPRTLALTVYGDLDVSMIARCRRDGSRSRPSREGGFAARRGLRDHPRRGRARGRQVYVIYPLVEESEKVDLKAATEMADHIARRSFRSYRVALLHGRMKRTPRTG